MGISDFYIQDRLMGCVPRREGVQTELSWLATPALPKASGSMERMHRHVLRSGHTM